MTVLRNSQQAGGIEKVLQGYFERGDRTLLVLTGVDVRDFLQRMSTNDLTTLDDGPVQTALTTEKGRMVDIVTVMKLEDKSVLLSGISGDQNKTVAWLERFIFMDDVSVRMASSEYRHIVFPEELPHPPPAGARQFRDAWGFHVILPKGSAGAYVAELNMKGVEHLSPGILETYRIMRGIPDWPSEVSIEYNPLEAGFTSAVSWTKGCYVGQEVIARLDTYKKLQRRLVNLLIHHNSSPRQNLYIGKELIGSITSVSLGFDGNHHALGYVRPAIADAKMGMDVGSPGSGITALIKE